MPKNILEERLRWVLPIVSKQIKLADAIKVCPHGKRTLERWLSDYKKVGKNGLIPKSTRPKTNPKELPINIKEQVLSLRKKTNLSALKLKWKLQKEGVYLHERTIGKYLKQEGLVRKYRTRKVKYKYIKVPLSKGELVEIDFKYVPDLIGEKQYYQFTAIDCASRWRYLEIKNHGSSEDAINFLKQLIRIAPFRIRAIKTDNGGCFTNRYTGYQKSADPLNPNLHAFDLLCMRQNIIHYLIDPGKPAQNGKVERSHREDQEKLYDRVKFKDLNELKLKVRLWNMYYNDLEHCGLNGLTPNQMLQFN